MEICVRKMIFFLCIVVSLASLQPLDGAAVADPNTDILTLLMLLRKDVDNIGKVVQRMEQNQKKEDAKIKELDKRISSKTNPMFVAVDYVADRSNTISKDGVSLDECVTWCTAIRSTRGPTWNGFAHAKMWAGRDNYCECYENAHGQFSEPGFFLYRWM